MEAREGVIVRRRRVMRGLGRGGLTRECGCFGRYTLPSNLFFYPERSKILELQEICGR